MTDDRYIVRTQNGSYEDLSFAQALDLEAKELNRGKEVTIEPRTKR